GEHDYSNSFGTIDEEHRRIPCHGSAVPKSDRVITPLHFETDSVPGSQFHVGRHDRLCLKPLQDGSLQHAVGPLAYQERHETSEIPDSRIDGAVRHFVPAPRFVLTLRSVGVYAAARTFQLVSLREMGQHLIVSLQS